MGWADMTDGPEFYRRTVSKGGTVKARGIVISSPALEAYVGQRVMVVDGFPDLIDIRAYWPDRPVGRRTGEPLLSVYIGSEGRVDIAYGKRRVVDGVSLGSPCVPVDASYPNQKIRTLVDSKYRPESWSSDE